MLNPHKCIQYIDINFSELIDVLKPGPKLSLTFSYLLINFRYLNNNNIKTLPRKSLKNLPELMNL